MILLWVAVGGACGALARYGLSVAVTAAAGDRLPWGTLAANLLGCFALGFLFEVARRSQVHPTLVQGLGVGFLGSFTTFSTFALESWGQLEEGRWGHLAANLTLNVVVGIVLVVLGMAAARLFLGGGGVGSAPAAG